MAKGKKKKLVRKQSSQKDPTVLSLTENELLKMEKLSTQVRACDGEVMITLSQKNGYIQKIDPQGVIGRFDQKINALKQERSEAEAAYKTVTSQVEVRLGIKLKEYAYDEATGVLRKIGDETVAKGPTPS
jgi:hypothetical protein